MIHPALRALWATAAALLLSLAQASHASAASAPPQPAERRAQAQALARATAAVVGVRTVAVADATTIGTLGRERSGSGVVIDADGLVLTIGYLIAEAEHVDLVVGAEHVVPARVLAYDPASGFGLVQGLVPLHLPAVRLGESSTTSVHEPLLIASGGENGELSLARLVAQRTFSGSWEYRIEGALFTTPERVDHSGAALFNAGGELLGIGSLLVMNVRGPDQPPQPGNLFVPVDLLKPILQELREHGAARNSTRPWLGVQCVERAGAVWVLRTLPNSPAEQAGLLPGDRIDRIDGVTVTHLDGFYTSLWRGEGAKRAITLDIMRADAPQAVTLHSRDRLKMLRRPQGI